MNCTQSLLSLPSELLLKCICYLEPRDVDITRDSCHRLRRIISDNRLKAYSRRTIDAVVKCDVDNPSNTFTISWRFRKNDEDGLLTDNDQQWGLKDMDRFPHNKYRGDVLSDFAENVLIRTSGFSVVVINGNLDDTALEELQPLFCQAECIAFANIKATAVSAEKQFMLMCSTRLIFIESRPNFFTEDRFWAEAGKHCLRITNFSLKISLTNTQLAILASRKDLDKVDIRPCRGPSVEGIRKAIEILLQSSVNFYMEIYGEYTSGNCRVEVFETNFDEEIDVEVGEEDCGIREYNYKSHSSQLILHVQSHKIAIFANNE